MLNRAALAPILLFSALELLGVGGVGAWLAVQLHFSYSLLTPLAFAIYGAAGLYARRVRASGWLAGAIVAVLDAGAWATFGGVGPQPTDPHTSTGIKVFTVLFAVALGALAGAIGGWIGTRPTTAGGGNVAA